MKRNARTIACAMAGLTVAFFIVPDSAAAQPAAKVDQRTLEQGIALVQSGKLAEAEKPLRDVLAAIDAGSFPDKNQLGRCLRHLAEINRNLGRRDDDALRIALRYRQFILGLTALGPAELDQNAADLADILSAQGKPAEAEKYLSASLAAAEKQADANPLRALALLVKAARLAEAQDDAAKARQRWDRVVELGQAATKKIAEQPSLIGQYPEVATALATAYEATENYPAAIAALNRLLRLQLASRDSSPAVQTRINIGWLHEQARQHPQAVQVLEDALAQQRLLATDSAVEAELLSRLARIHKSQGSDSAARKHWENALAIYAKAIDKVERLPDGQTQAMNLLDQLQIVQRQAGRLSDAVATCHRLVLLRSKTLGDEHPLTIDAKSSLGALYGAVGYYELGRPLLAESLSYWRRQSPASPLKLAQAMNDLAVVESGIGSFGEAKVLLEQALGLRKQNLRPDDLRLANSYANLAQAHLAKGEYARAVVLLDQAIEIYEGHGHSADEALSGALLNQAMVFKSQGQLTKAVEYCLRALQVYQRAFGLDSSGAVAYYNALASLCIGQSRLAQAAEFNDRAMELCRQHKLDRSPMLGTALHHKATIGYLRDDLTQAQRDWQTALAIQKDAGQMSQVARTLNYLAKIAALQNKTDEAEPLYRQALQLQGAAQAYPMMYYATNCNLAEILHDQGKTDEAIKLLHDAVKVIETPRAGAVGGEGERAEYFSKFASAFDLLVSWNLELGRVDEAFAYAERGRNRTFLDQLALAGIDLRDTLTGPAGERLRSRERELRGKLGTLRAQALALAQPGAKNDAASSTALDKMLRNLETLQNEYAQVWSDIRNASPYYREQLAQSDKLNALAVVRDRLRDLKSVMLFYYVGANKSVLLVIDPAAEKVEVVPLEVPAALATAMNVKAGPVTRAGMVQLVNQYLADVRDRAGGRGLGGVVRSERGVMAADQGVTLAEVLVPRAVRNIVARRAPQSVIVVPDGALHELPFEALLLESRPAPKYLLDVFPPIAYTPSANILVNLLAPAASSSVATLSVGNPKYPEGKIDAPDTKLAKRSMTSVARAAYLGLGGQLPPLPATALECERIMQAFQGGKVATLQSERATEKNLRTSLADCRFLHVAAHGLVDQQHDNLFGAIALTPPVQTVDSADDDGFLSLSEIHNLPLAGCQLAVLSACQTNVGPERPLEAGSTLAQAFLAAGARRVICSHWNVDDASTAELIGTFFERVASKTLSPAGRGQIADSPWRGEGDSAAADPIAYATALHEAQKKVRAQSKWSSPYYWAPFVLIGPPQ